MLDLGKLESAAGAAGYKQWAYVDTSMGRYVVPLAHKTRPIGSSTNRKQDEQEYAHQICEVRGKYQASDDANAQYIALACPANIHELIQSHRSLEQKNVELSDLVSASLLNGEGLAAPTEQTPGVVVSGKVLAAALAALTELEKRCEGSYQSWKVRGAGSVYEEDHALAVRAHAAREALMNEISAAGVVDEMYANNRETKEQAC